MHRWIARSSKEEHVFALFILAGQLLRAFCFGGLGGSGVPPNVWTWCLPLLFCLPHGFPFVNNLVVTVFFTWFTYLQLVGATVQHASFWEGTEAQGQAESQVCRLCYFFAASPDGSRILPDCILQGQVLKVYHAFAASILNLVPYTTYQVKSTITVAKMASSSKFKVHSDHRHVHLISQFAQTIAAAACQCENAMAPPSSIESILFRLIG